MMEGSSAASPVFLAKTFADFLTLSTSRGDSVFWVFQKVNQQNTLIINVIEMEMTAFLTSALPWSASALAGHVSFFVAVLLSLFVLSVVVEEKPCFTSCHNSWKKCFRLLPPLA